VVAIAQGSSERSISAVVKQSACADAVKVSHENFFTHIPSIDVFLVGCGVVGGELLAQIHQQKAFLAERQVRLRVYGVANSKQALLVPDGVDLSRWQQYCQQRANFFRADFNRVCAGQSFNQSGFGGLHQCRKFGEKLC
jgi:aspartokinase/homoserine dehydrogenase 1